MSKGYIELLSFGSDFQLFVFGHAFECSHVVKTVAQLNQNHPHVITHCGEQLLEVFALNRVVGIVKHTFDFCKTIDNLGNLFIKDMFYVFQCIFRIFDNVMQESTNHSRCTQSQIFCGNGCNLQRVINIRFARFSSHSCMGVHCNRKSLSYLTFSFVCYIV